jgi:hypothetical protein
MALLISSLAALSAIASAIHAGSIATKMTPSMKPGQ